MLTRINTERSCGGQLRDNIEIPLRQGVKPRRLRHVWGEQGKHQAGTRKGRETPRRLFFLFFSGAVRM